MAVVDKIILDGTSYDIQDTETLQKVENVTDAVNGKPTAEIVYDNTDSALSITTGTITVTSTVASIDENLLESTENSISAVKLNGTSYAISSGGDGTKYLHFTFTNTAFTVGQTQTFTLITSPSIVGGITFATHESLYKLSASAVAVGTASGKFSVDFFTVYNGPQSGNLYFAITNTSGSAINAVYEWHVTVTIPAEYAN